MIITQTKRLTIRYLTLSDAEFWRDLLCTPSFIKNIGDRNVRTKEDAELFLKERIFPQYEVHGMHMFMLELREPKTPIGSIGLLVREGVENVDIGFALLPEFEGKGYAFEASTALLAFGYQTMKLPKIIAFTSHDNIACQKLLKRLDLVHTHDRPWPPNTTDTSDITMVFEPKSPHNLSKKSP